MAHTPYKYKLHEFLMNLPHRNYVARREMIAKQVGVSKHTFRQWQYIKADSSREIPGIYLIKLAEFFKVLPHEMFNKPIEPINIKE